MGHTELSTYQKLTALFLYGQRAASDWLVWIRIQLYFFYPFFGLMGDCKQNYISVNKSIMLTNVKRILRLIFAQIPPK